MTAAGWGEPSCVIRSKTIVKQATYVVNIGPQPQPPTYSKLFIGSVIDFALVPVKFHNLTSDNLWVRVNLKGVV